MRIDILTLFPGAFSESLGVSIIGRARQNGVLEILTHDIRRFSHDEHGTVDDRPYGGGPGMVMKPEPVFEAVEFVRGLPKEEVRDLPCRIILMTPKGETLSQGKVNELVREKHIIVICGRYEGVDERVSEKIVTDEISIGDYVLCGGEVPAMVLIEAVARLLPGVLGDENSARCDSFSEGVLEYPQYTRPPEYRGMKVPEVLCSGNHEEIRKWRRRESLRRTLERRPDMFEKLTLNKEDEMFLER